MGEGLSAMLAEQHWARPGAQGESAGYRYSHGTDNCDAYLNGPPGLSENQLVPGPPLVQVLTHLLPLLASPLLQPCSHHTVRTLNLEASDAMEAANYT